MSGSARRRKGVMDSIPSNDPRRRIRSRTAAILVLSALAALLCGCGGGNASGGAAPGDGPALTGPGRAVCTIVWPDAAAAPGDSRLIPAATRFLEIKLTLWDAANNRALLDAAGKPLLVQRALVERPANNSPSSVPFPNLPAVPMLFEAAAWPDNPDRVEDGQGARLAFASRVETIQATGQTDIQLSLQSDIAVIEVTPAAADLAAGTDLPLTIQARSGTDPNAPTVFLSPERIRIVSEAPAKVAVKSQNPPLLTAVEDTAGQEVTITVTDLDSGRSGTTRIKVGAFVRLSVGGVVVPPGDKKVAEQGGALEIKAETPGFPGAANVRWELIRKRDGVVLANNAPANSGDPNDGPPTLVISGATATFTPRRISDAPAAGEDFTVRAISNTDAARLAEVTVTVPPIVVSPPVPAAATLLQGAEAGLVTTVAGAAVKSVTYGPVESLDAAAPASDPNNPRDWTRVLNGVWTAPAGLNAEGTYRITARSSVDPGKTSFVIITVRPVAVQITTTPPQLPSSIFQFQASVAGAVDTSVVWSLVNGLGAIDANTGVYRSPAVTPSGTNLVITVRASSRANPSASSDLTVTLASQNVDFTIR